jgi:hypothetical protein
MANFRKKRKRRKRKNIYSRTRMIKMERSVNDQAKDIPAGNGTVGAAIERIGSVISENEILADPAFEELIPKARSRESLCSERKVRFGELFAVHINDTFSEVNRITRHRDDSLDGEPAVEGIAQNNNFRGLRGPEVKDPAVEQVELGIAKGGHHAHSDDAHGLDAEMADQQVAGKNADQQSAALSELLAE